MYNIGDFHLEIPTPRLRTTELGNAYCNLKKTHKPPEKSYPRHF